MGEEVGRNLGESSDDGDSAGRLGDKFSSPSHETPHSESAAAKEETEARSSRFVCLPELERYFKKRRMASGKMETICQACSTNIKTQEIKRLTKHVAKCRFTSREAKDYLAQITINNPKINHTLDNDFQESANMAWAAVMVENNIPLSILTCNSFKKFIKLGCPHWKIPTPEVMAAKYINVATLRSPPSSRAIKNNK